MQSSIDILIPTAASVIGPWYAETPAATDGMPRHLTLLWPWVDAPVDLEAVDRASAALVGIAPFEITFDRCGRFPGVLFLLPEPRAPIELLIGRLADAFPERPPYGGMFGTAPPPHLTVAKNADDGVLDAIQAEVEGRLGNVALSALVEQISISEEGLGANRAGGSDVSWAWPD